MFDENDDFCDVPVVTLPAEVYDAVLLVDAVLIVAEGPPGYHGRLGKKLPDFFAVRPCLLNRASGGYASRPSCTSDNELLHRKVGG